MTKRYILLINETKEDMVSYVDVFSCENLTRKDYDLFFKLIDMDTDYYSFISCLGEDISDLQKQISTIKQGVSDKVKQELEDPELFTTKVAQYDTFEDAMYDLGIFEPEFIEEYYSKQQ